MSTVVDAADDHPHGEHITKRGARLVELDLRGDEVEVRLSHLGDLGAPGNTRTALLGGEERERERVSGNTRTALLGERERERERERRERER